ncbi:AAA family ATPase [Tenacibaculum discolor]|uniref:AAA family ATPase n=1 Tax=Tenacibaculum discolor TaxID=361581 RepID=UPI003F79C2E7
MTELKIKNVGPIREGYQSNNGFIPVNDLTVFIGNQGSGKSTVAKIYSTLSWVEKALVRGDFTPSYLSQYNRFKKQLAYQNISNYLSDDSEIEYKGRAYHLKYKNNKLTIQKNKSEDSYTFPKIMYVPAERNFVSSVDKPDLIKRLPLPLYTFLDEYEEAKKNCTEGVKLPIGNLKFEYRKQNKKSWLVGNDYRIELLEASSGFQSFVPLFLVTKNLSKTISQRESDSHREISISEEKRIRKEIDSIFGNKNISEDIRRVLLEKLSARFRYSCFLNIVEEPEQNLFPTSQKEILFDLIESKNEGKNNQLIITTHSPYIINFITLAIKAEMVKRKSKNKPNILEKLNSVVPLKSTIPSSSVSIFQLDNNGKIEKLDDYKGLPDDENYLNYFLAEFNDLFVKLIEIEDLCQ